MHDSQENEVIIRRLDEVKPLISEICKCSGSAGLSYGVVHDGKIICQADFGYRDVESQIVPDSNTLYSINSMTKAFTAAAIAILVEDGKTKWDTPLNTILPGFGDPRGDVGSMLNVTDLLSHRSGIASPDSFFFQDHNRLLLDKGQAIPTFDYAKQKDHFRASFLYNNFAYAVAALIVERLSGQEFGRFLKEKIFDPLQLQRTTTDDVSNDINVSKSYSVLDDRSLFAVPSPNVGTGTVLEGAAGVKSTVIDLLRVYKAFLDACNRQVQQGTNSTEGSPFKQCPILIQGHNFLGGSYLREQSYGLGWVRCQLPGPLGRQGINAGLNIDLPVVGAGAPSRLCLYHQGLMPGSSTVVYAFPETTTAIVVLQSSTALNDCPDWVGQLLVDTVFDHPQKNNYLKLASESAKKSLALVPSMNSKLESERVPDTKPSLSLEAYCGRYFNKIKNFFIEVSQHHSGLRLAFQGLESQSHPLRHYNYDTFTWQMTHNEAAQRARLPFDYPPEYYLIRFGIDEDGNVDRLYWVTENSIPEEEPFMRSSIATNLE